MTVILYNNYSDPDELTKVLDEGKSVTAEIKGACSVDNPNLILDYDGVDFNYMYIQEFGRYYDVDNRTVTTGGRVIVSGSSDPLYSFADALKQMTVYVARTENAGDRNPLIIDNMIPLITENTVEMYESGLGNVIGSGVTYVLGVLS